MSENLATIQRVKNVRNCPESDNLDICNILGWQVVVKRNEFAENDLCIYICIDTILPEKPEFEFLRNKHFRIRPIRLRKQESAGIAFPLSILPVKETPYVEGEDVSNIIEVVHYEKPLSPQLAGQAIGNFPGFLKITDEDNLRSYPDAIPELYSRPYYITQKIDGSSFTCFINNNEFGVCSRRIHLKETEGNGFWKLARRYDIENILKKAFPDMNIAIQSEIYGNGIQKNPLGIKETDMALFNIFDINNRTYLDYDKLVAFTTEYKIPMVPLINEGTTFHYTLEELIKLANEQKYSNGNVCEGLVCRPKESFYSTILKKYWSGKVISESYKD
jgi:RNA ligase (TIGR02306 family)